MNSIKICGILAVVIGLLTQGLILTESLMNWHLDAYNKPSLLVIAVGAILIVGSTFFHKAGERKEKDKASLSHGTFGDI